MSDEIPEKCPYCEAAAKQRVENGALYECGSQLSISEHFGMSFQRTPCIIRQRDSLLAQVSELAAAINAKVPVLLEQARQMKKAGDMLASHCDDQLALHEWLKAKGEA